ncbi:MAG: ABC transporter permease [Mobilitalea sp.]
MMDNNKTNKKTSINVRAKLIKYVPIIGLVLVIVVFAALTKGKTVSSVNLKILTNQVVLTALVAIGAVFSFSCGAFDMSLGGSLCLSAIAGALAGTKTNSLFVMILVTFLVSMTIALFKGIIAANLTLPIFIVTIIFSSFLSAIGLVLLGKETTISLGKLVNIKSMTVINITLLAGFYLLSLFLFNYTKIGKSMKLQGGNMKAANQSGINSKRNVIIAFAMSGLGVALAAIITLLRTKTATPTTGGSIGNDILVAIVLGGMPLSGGSNSKISAAIIGAATITILNNGLSVYGVSNDMIQIVRGVIFLGVVSITALSYRTKLLPR